MKYIFTGILFFISILNVNAQVNFSKNENKDSLKNTIIHIFHTDSKDSIEIFYKKKHT